jgi:ADP-heptose:LPS heptosyltransferase
MDTPVSDVGKIAVLRANAIGNFIFALPALEALRTAYPRAEIVLLATDWHAEFLVGRPSPIDRVIPVTASTGVRVDLPIPTDPTPLARFFETMRSERFDIAVQIHGGGRYSNPFVDALGARLTVGLRTPDAAPLDRWMPYIYFQSEVLRYLEVVGLIGAPPVTLLPRIALTAADRSEAERAMPSTGRVAVLHPGAGDPRRRWPPAHFAAVGDALAGAGAQVAVVGAPGERALVAAVVSAMAHPAVDLCGQLSLGGLAGLFARAQVVVANDSGPLHLAEAVGCATVGIFWCGNLITAGPLHRARHRPQVSWQLTCPACGRHCLNDTCDHTCSFVAEAPVEAATSAALELLTGRR